VNDTFHVGRIGGVRVGVNWSLLVVAGLLAVLLADNQFPVDAPGYSRPAYWAAGLIGAVALFVGVLLHELGHAVVARRAGLAVDGITLWFMGGMTRIEGESPTPGDELRISVVGPGVSAALGFGCAGLRWVVEQAGVPRLTLSVLGWLAVINIALAVFNLLPASPLDGGRILRSAIWAVTKDRFRATRYASAAGVVLAAGLVGLGIAAYTRAQDLNGLTLVVLGWFVYTSARGEAQAARVHQSLDGMTVAEIMRPVRAAPGWMTVQAFLEAEGADRASVFMLEEWGGTRTVALASIDGLAALPFDQRQRRVLDAAVPVNAARGAAPSDEVLAAMLADPAGQILLVIDGGYTVGAVLPTDVDRVIDTGRRPLRPAPGPLATGPRAR
jgi:Zn-dependent protease